MFCHSLTKLRQDHLLLLLLLLYMLIHKQVFLFLFYLLNHNLNSAPLSTRHFSRRTTLIKPLPFSYASTTYYLLMLYKISRGLPSKLYLI